nr:hypothetical protein [Tanacetum cinerariifolium]
MLKGNIPSATSVADVAATWASEPSLASPRYCSCQSEVRCQVAGGTRFRMQVRGVMIGSRSEPIIGLTVQGSGSTCGCMRLVDLGILQLSTAMYEVPVPKLL